MSPYAVPNTSSTVVDSLSGSKARASAEVNRLPSGVKPLRSPGPQPVITTKPLPGGPWVMRLPKVAPPSASGERQASMIQRTVPARQSRR